jgi:hypothetical protein
MAKPPASWLLFTVLVATTLVLVAALMLAEAVVAGRFGPPLDAAPSRANVTATCLWAS